MTSNEESIERRPKETTDRYGWEFRNMRRMIRDLLAYGFIAEEIKEMLQIDTKEYWNHTGRKRH